MTERLGVWTRSEVRYQFSSIYRPRPMNARSCVVTAIVNHIAFGAMVWYCQRKNVNKSL
jgi:hypothetical protein